MAKGEAGRSSVMLGMCSVASVFLVAIATHRPPAGLGETLVYMIPGGLVAHFFGPAIAAGWQRLQRRNTAQPAAPARSAIGTVISIIPKQVVRQRDVSATREWMNVSFPSIVTHQPSYPTVVLAFEGYDQDPRGVLNSPEVVAWFKAIAAHCPAAPYFLSPHSIQLYFAALSGMPAGRGTMGLDLDALRRHVERTFGAANGAFAAALGGQRPACLDAADRRISDATKQLMEGRWLPV